MAFLSIASFLLVFLLLHGVVGKLGMIGPMFMARKPAVVLRELTGIDRRADLIARFGPHDEDYRFTAGLKEMMAARPWWRWIFGNALIEIVLVAFLLASVLGVFAPHWGLVLAAFAYFMIHHAITWRSLKASRAEVEEEMANAHKRKRERIMGRTE